MIFRLPLFCVSCQYGSLSKNKTIKCVKCDVYNIMEYLTYKAISNFDKGAKIYFVSSMASRSTVSLKLFASKLCFLVCQQNLLVELNYDSATDFENLVAFQSRP